MSKEVEAAVNWALSQGNFEEDLKSYFMEIKGQIFGIKELLSLVDNFVTQSPRDSVSNQAALYNVIKSLQEGFLTFERDVDDFLKDWDIE